MATTIRISGVDIERLKGSLSISDTLEQRSTASFVVVDRLGTASYYRGQSVEIFEGIAIPPFIHPLFSGYIDYPKRKRLSANSSELYWTINCIDNHYLADKRIAAESYTGQTAGFIVTDLWTKYLQAEGVTLGTIDAGPTIAEMVINYRSINDALAALAARSNKIWFINKGKELYFIDRSTLTAPFSITSNDIVREASILSELTEKSPKYRNRQYIRGGRDITLLQTETRTGDGDIVAFPMGFPLAREPVVTVGAAAQSVGIKGIDTAEDVYWTYGDPIITFTVAPGIGAAIVVKYYGLYNIMVQVDLLPEQAARQAIEGGTGIVEALDDDPSAEDKDDALEIALSTLEHYGVIGKQFTFPIRTWGLEPGQMAPVTHTPYGLNGDLLVESVDISETAPGELRYTIKAIEGPEMGDWTGFFKSLADVKNDIMDRITVGADKILIILVSETEGVEVSETFAVDAYACTVCNGTACGDGVIVC